VSTIGTGVIDC